LLLDLRVKTGWNFGHFAAIVSLTTLVEAHAVPYILGSHLLRGLNLGADQVLVRV
jgi:hypothetical protein